MGAVLFYQLALRTLLEERFRLMREALFPQLSRFAKVEPRLDASDTDDVIRAVNDAAGARAAGDAAIGRVEAVARRTRAHVEAEMARIGFNLEAEPGMGGIIDDFRGRNVTLVSSVADSALPRLERILREGREKRVSTLRDEILEAFEVTKSRADLIARDQVLKLNAQVTAVRMQAAGIEQYIWTTSGDERVRESHAELDGETFAWQSPPEPGHPGEDYQCRCTAYPVVPELADADADESGGDE